MELQVLFCVLLSVCIVGNVKSSDDEHPPEMQMRHPFTEHEKKCKHPSFREEFNKIMMKSMCKSPIDTVVQLFPESPEHTYIPSAVVVKRCGGMCSEQLSCVATEKVEIPISVHLNVKGESKPACGQVIIEEHVRCKCACAKMEHHCNKLQEYNGAECACNCMNMEKKEECEKADKLWDQKTCKCNCKEEQEECTTGSYWVPELCKCVQMS